MTDVPLMEPGLQALREGVCYTWHPHFELLSVQGDGAFELLDRALPAELKLRDGQARHTLLLDDDARPSAELYVLRHEDGFLLLVEGLTAMQLQARLEPFLHLTDDVVLTPLDDYAALELAGPFAWELLTQLEDPHLMGIPYLTFVQLEAGTFCLRAGRTGEFGYLFLAPRAALTHKLAALQAQGEAFGFRELSSALYRVAMFESWFFDPLFKPHQGLTAFELQLQWRLSPRKDFPAQRVLEAQRQAPDAHRIVGIESETALRPEASLTLGTQHLGRVLTSLRSPTHGRWIGTALLPKHFSHPGIHDLCAEDQRLVTVSAPFVTTRSLFVNPQKHNYATRDELVFPGSARLAAQTLWQVYPASTSR